MKRYKILGTTLALFALVVIYLLSHFATEHRALHLLDKLPQNASAYINPKQTYSINYRNQALISKNYIDRYFLPWDEQLTQVELDTIKDSLSQEATKFEQAPGIGANTRPYNQEWIKNIENNMDMGRFPNLNQAGITLRESNMRVLPTLDPSFTDFNSVSKGYPFDNLQQTFVPSGTPVHIIQTSKDKAWYFVTACSYFGWISTKDVAVTNAQFRQQWQTGQYAVSIQDNIPLLDGQHRLMTKTRIGVLYPIVKTLADDYQVLVVTGDYTSSAQAQVIQVSKDFLNPFPVPISNYNIARVANNLIGKPYGWGGVYGYRDCSATTRDLMATFGIWLARNSIDQESAGQTFSLTKLSPHQKEQTIVKHAIPFLTLIHLPGHIVLYVGQRHGHPLVFQNMWGLHVFPLFNHQDRIVIGKTVITPLNFGSKFINVTGNHLKAADAMTLLVDPKLLEK